MSYADMSLPDVTCDMLDTIYGRGRWTGQMVGSMLRKHLIEHGKVEPATLEEEQWLFTGVVREAARKQQARNSKPTSSGKVSKELVNWYKKTWPTQWSENITRALQEFKEKMEQRWDG